MLWKHLRAVLIGPVVVTIVVPALILGTVGAGSLELRQPYPWLLGGVGAVVAAFGVAMLVWTITLFDRAGKGTLSPFDPPTELVLRGPYRYVRNPMFTGVLAILLGEAVAARSPALLIWFALFFLFVSIAVPLGEERRLAHRFGADYARYRAHVPRWIPRLRPWSPQSSHPLP